MSPKRSLPAPKPINTFADVLAAAGERPAPGSGKSAGYSTKFANAMATLVANAFRSKFPGIKPDAGGLGVESPSRAVRGLKRLDVNYSTPQAGLCFGISLKSVHLPDKNPTHRFHHNMKRNDEELRVEAAGYHQRQPYSVLVAVVMLPLEACEDADNRPSSFGKWVQYLWPLAGRKDPHDDVDRFESVFVALYGWTTPELSFFDVTVPPPKIGRPDPRKLLSLDEFAARVIDMFEKRNALDFAWETGERDAGSGEENGEIGPDDAETFAQAGDLGGDPPPTKPAKGSRGQSASPPRKPTKLRSRG